MILQSSDGARMLDTGSGDLLHSIYSTVQIRLGYLLVDVPLALSFLQTGTCRSAAGLATARQLNLIHDGLAQVPPEKAVFDMGDLHKAAPWANNLSPVITSCANLYTTADGQDLFFELVSILVYGGILGTDITRLD